jgi:23S rRNA pseudouridine1911/1915/1917 synthase
MPGPGARNLVVAATVVGPGAPRSAAALGRLRPAAVRRYTAAVPVPAPWTAAATAAGSTLAAEVRAASGEPWSVVKKWIATGKVWVGGAVVTAIDLRLRGGEAVEVRLAAPEPRDPLREADLVHDDAHVVVIDKPAGVSSVPYDERETGTAMDLIRAAWRRMGRAATVTPLHVVHRIDKATSGLLMFAKSKRAELGLAAQLRDHSCERTYRCVAHGVVHLRRSRRGWSPIAATAPRLDLPRQPGQARGHPRHRARAPARRDGVRGPLETGKTHQIRIHLAEPVTRWSARRSTARTSSKPAAYVARARRGSCCTR